MDFSTLILSVLLILANLCSPFSSLLLIWNELVCLRLVQGQSACLALGGPGVDFLSHKYKQAKQKKHFPFLMVELLVTIFFYFLSSNVILFVMHI